MDTLNIVFGVIGLISLIFSIYTYYKTESKKTIEAAKAAMIKERFRNLRLSLLGIYNTIDSIVQIPKQGKISIGQLQHLARVVRAQVVVLTNQVELEQRKLEEWRYGKIIDSDFDNRPQEKEVTEKREGVDRSIKEKSV